MRLADVRPFLKQAEEHGIFPPHSLEDHENYFGFLTRLNQIPRGKAQGALGFLRDLTLPFYAHIEVVPLKKDRKEVQGPGCL
jgi:hypothetical protein